MGIHSPIPHIDDPMAMAPHYDLAARNASMRLLGHADRAIATVAMLLRLLFLESMEG